MTKRSKPGRRPPACCGSAPPGPHSRMPTGEVDAFVAVARGDPGEVLRHARASMASANTIGPHSLRWAWPLAARAAHDLGDAAAVGELLALIDFYPPGHLAPMLRAERDLACARLAARDGEPAAADMFASAISSLRELSTPYHLAHGLLDYAQHLDSEAAEAAIREARDSAARLRCQPLLDRAADLLSAQPPVQA